MNNDCYGKEEIRRMAEDARQGILYPGIKRPE